MQMMQFSDLKKQPLQELNAILSRQGLKTKSENRQDMIHQLIGAMEDQKHPVSVEGSVEVLADGFGFLRFLDQNYLASSQDVYLSPQQVRSYHLKTGDTLQGTLSAPRENESFCSLKSVLSINGADPKNNRNRVPFEQLTPLFPTRKINLESPLECAQKTPDVTLRTIELVSPLGFGQRALIVAPPRTGKTVILQKLIRALMAHHPETHVMVLMIGERPEEVTEMSRMVIRGEVMSSTFDEPAIRHIQVAEMALEKAKRLVENKKDVVIFLDSITRLARSYNTSLPSSGKVLTGGVDANALQKPKRIFGAARNVEEGGSLTIIATTLVETGSKMDEVIFEEFKGTGNAEISLDRKLSDKRTFPAIDVAKSGTRREEFLIEPAFLQKHWLLRRILSSMSSVEATEFLIEKLRQTKTNSDFFDMMNRPL